mmetsp:Transcript_72816/g.126375  ORF Transcript_72816/g.126375 Transcript_72816/m.126375 type:complete len:84 (-) Transcript_72816:7-258(-)
MPIGLRWTFKIFSSQSADWEMVRVHMVVLIMREGRLIIHHGRLSTTSFMLDTRAGQHVLWPLQCNTTLSEGSELAVSGEQLSH